MEHVFAVRNESDLSKYRAFAERIQPRLDEYTSYLDRTFGLGELPRVILWTDRETATKLISDIPIPAYTNDFRIVFTPDLCEWQDIYLKQLDGLEPAPLIDGIRNYYTQRLTENHLLQILGHELAHHIELFDDTDYESGIWFEEGMAEYISRRYFLTEQEFQKETEINHMLVQLHAERYGNHSIEAFGAETYAGDYASIFFEYWRAFLAVKDIVDAYDGNIKRVFQIYHQWCVTESGMSLSAWFEKRKRQP